MKMLKKTYHILLSLMSAALLLPSLTACNAVVDGEEVERVENVNYINLTLYVSSGETVTRGPNGGEDGDGREAGFERENLVGGITLILYKGSGIDDPAAKVDFVRYFTVTEANLEGRDPQGTTYDYKASETYRSEARYTTGDQKLTTGELDLQGTYHVLIVANQNVSSSCPKGTLISTVRDLKLNNVHASYTPGNPVTAQQFVMTTERDATINFAMMAPVQKAGVQNGLVYRVMQPMLIERMLARIDYNTKGSSYDTEKEGYIYPVGSTADKFVVTKITPFNLYNEDEYLFKRVQDAWPATATTYLGDETLTNYVADPKTATKDNTSTMPSYLSPIAADMSTSNYVQTMSTVSTDAKFNDANGNENIIIAYPKENTLMPTSQLKKYATGLAFSIDYYTGGTGTPEHRTYYYYLRHQGESTGSYKAQQWADLVDTDDASAKPMNFGIVRNNIYRVSIEGMTEDAKLILHIKVKKWDIFEHAPIYM